MQTSVVKKARRIMRRRRPETYEMCVMYLADWVCRETEGGMRGGGRGPKGREGRRGKAGWGGGRGEAIMRWGGDGGWGWRREREAEGWKGVDIYILMGYPNSRQTRALDMFSMFYSYPAAPCVQSDI